MAGSIPLKVETLPLLDRRRRVLSDLRISVIDRCNFRCPYCMPEGNYPLDHAFLEKGRPGAHQQWQPVAAHGRGICTPQV